MINEDLMPIVSEVMSRVLQEKGGEGKHPIGFATLIFRQCDECQGLDINYCGTFDPAIATGIMDMFRTRIEQELKEKNQGLMKQ